MKNETISFEEIRPHLLYRFQNEAHLLKSVTEVGKLFNFYRENISEYREDEKLVAAYCAYYLTTNYPKLFSVLDLLGDRLDLNEYDRVVDIGTGPGTFLLALDKLCSPETKLEGVDISETMLAQAAKILEGLASGREIRLGRKPQAGEKGEKTLLVFTHSLNEMPLEEASNYIDAVSPQSILLIEPGTMQSFEKVLQVREKALKDGFDAAYPCHSNAPCPLDPEKDWCHQYIQVEHSLDVERITQKLHKNRRLLPLIAQLYLKKFDADNGKARLIRVKKPTKHSLEWDLCEAKEGRNQVFEAEIPKRGMPKKNIKKLEDVMAGVDVDYEEVRQLEGKTRVAIRNLEDLI